MELTNSFPRGNGFGDYSSFIPSSMSFLLTVGFLKVGNQPITGNAKKGRTPVIHIPFPTHLSLAAVERKGKLL